MGRLKVDTTVLNAQAASIQNVMRQLDTVAQQIQGVSNSLTWQIPVSGQMRSRLISYGYAVEQMGVNVGKAGAALGQLAARYDTTETNNSDPNGIAETRIDRISEWLSKNGWKIVLPLSTIPLVAIPGLIGAGLLWMMNTDLGPSTWWSEDNASWRHLLADNDWKIGSGSAWARKVDQNGNEAALFKKTRELSSSRSTKFESDDAISKDRGWPEQKKYSTKTSDKYKDEEWYDNKGSIYERKIEQKGEFDLAYGKLSADGKAGSGSVEAKLGTAEAHASASAGLYVYEKDASGNVKRILAPAVDAEIGASVAVAELSADGRLGLGENHNMLGVYGEADATALSAEAQAGIHIGRGDVYAGASAEADLVKVSGSAGVTVLGTDVGVTGSLKVGVGAHAKVGYTDGKLKVDVGAAVGIGADVGFEVDVSGTVDAVTGFVADVADNASAVVDTIGDGLSKIGDAVSSIWPW